MPLAIGAMLLSGCVAATEIREFTGRTPLQPAGESRPIMFRKLVSKIPRGQEVGTVQGGLACGGQSKLFWKRGGQIQVGDEELVDALKDELTKAGYTVVGDPSSLFEDAQEWKAEFLIAGIIKHAALNVCYPLGGFMNFVTSKGEGSIEVEWQVFERRSRSVVLNVTTGGTAKTDSGPHQGIQAYYDAFAAAVRNLLAEQRFASLMSRPLARALNELEPIPIEVFALRDADPSKASEVIQHVRNAVVTIPVGSGHGSGVIINSAGLVLTNAHVVGEGSRMITVELASGRRVAGDVVRADRDVDVALIQLERGSYLAAPIAPSDALSPGGTVFAAGAPLDQRLSRTLTKGVISAFRLSEDGRRLIQSDVMVHPGSSGGPLLDERGRVVALTQSRHHGGTLGLNYFVPIEEALKALRLQPNFLPVTLDQLIAGRPQVSRLPQAPTPVPTQAQPGPPASASLSGPPPRVVVDIAAKALLGTWTGHLSPPPRNPSELGRRHPVTIKIFEESGEVRWEMTSLPEPQLPKSGTVSVSEDQVLLSESSTRTSSRAVAYSLSRRGKTLEGSRLGPDNRVYTLSVTRGE